MFGFEVGIARAEPGGGGVRNMERGEGGTEFKSGAMSVIMDIMSVF